MKYPRFLLAALVLALSSAAPAFAQSEGKFALGADFSIRLPANRQDVDGHKGVGLLWRFGHGKTGWGWHWGLNWYSADVDGPDRLGTELGELHVKPVMAGYGYTHVLGRTNVTGSVIAGYALVSMDVFPAAGDAYRDRFGARSLTVDVSNTFTAKPQVNVWYDLSKKVGLNVSAGYVIARPTLMIRSTLGTEERHINADMFTIKFGAAYSIF